MKNFQFGFYFVILLASFSLIQVYKSEYIITDYLYYEQLSDKLSETKIEALIKNRKNYTSKIIYTCLSAIFKMLLISAILLVASSFWGITLTFTEFFVIVSYAFFAFLLKEIFNNLYFSFSPNHQTLKAINTFQFGSVANFFNLNTLEQWLVTPLTSINIFEFLFGYFLAYKLKVRLNSGISETSKFVISSYGFAFVTYLLAISIFSILAK